MKSWYYQLCDQKNPIQVGMKWKYEPFLKIQVSEGYLNDINHLLESINCTNTALDSSLTLNIFVSWDSSFWQEKKKKII